MSNLLAILPPPPFEVSPYGLLSLPGQPGNGQDTEGPDDLHWIGGFTYESRLCSTTINMIDVCDGSQKVNIITASAPASAYSTFNRTFQPYTIEAVETNTSFGFEARRIQDRAVMALEAATQKAIEYEFWTGATAKALGYTGNRYLASSEAQDITPGGTPVKARYGLALLEQALATCSLGTRGVIHAPHSVASAMLPMPEYEGHLVTPIGNYIVAGSGYPGTGPDGTLPSTGTWLYATGAVQTLVGPTEVFAPEQVQTLDRDKNTFQARAHRAAAAVWDGCCTFAVHVDLTLDYS